MAGNFAFYFVSIAQGNIAVAVTLMYCAPVFVALGVVGGGISFFLYLVGLRRTTPIAASIVAMVEPVTASLFGVVVLDESLAGLQFFGMGLILVSVTGLRVHSSAWGRPSDPTNR